MGIPKFYRWLTTRYPFICAHVDKEDDVPPIDNFYIDLNGLIHNVIHGNSADKHIIISHLINTGNSDELWGEIFRAIDDLVHLINPRKFLMIALDSVTPVAKMTQQRSRRIKGETTLSNIAEFTKLQSEKELFDVNGISPGTPFMAELNKQLDFFLMSKVNEDPLYQRIKIVFSDSNAPGEGEHKIMEYLRCLKNSPEYTPNLRHCIYGLDADLIMLALVSHEPNMTIVRDITDSHSSRDNNNNITLPRQAVMKTQEYEILFISVLREYFELEFAYLEAKIKFKYNIERIIDDFVFFSFFVGNDFLPYLNTVDINYGSLDVIMRIYKDLLPKLNTYITESGKINWENAEAIFAELGKTELKVFQERIGVFIEDEPMEKPKEKQLEQKLEDSKRKLSDNIELAAKVLDLGEQHEISIKDAAVVPIIEEEKEPESDVESKKSFVVTDPRCEEGKLFYMKMCELYQKDMKEAKKLYYLEKLKIDLNTESGVKAWKALVSKYLEGLQWVLYYYYKGVQHWGWYYPYHYAPLISDIISVKEFIRPVKPGEPEFVLKEPNNPLTPFQQLLCILPKASIALLPKRYHRLYDEGSEIKDLYPEKYELDYNGREVPWEAIKIIPFVDINRVLEAEAKLLSRPDIEPLTEPEKERNIIRKPTEYAYSLSAPPQIIYSTIKEMPKLINPTCIKREYVLPADPHKVTFLPILHKDTELPCYDFPSLKYVKIQKTEIQKIKFEDDEFDKIMLTLEDSQVPEEELGNLLGKIVYINYPFQSEARIMSLTTAKYTFVHQFNPDKAAMELIKHENKDTKILDAAIKALKTRGVKAGETGQLKFVCFVAPMEFITKNFNGTEPFSKAYSNKVEPYPSCILMFSRDSRNYLNCDKWITDQSLQYPINSPCAIVRGKEYGSMGKIVDSSTKNQIKVQLSSNINRKSLDSLWAVIESYRKQKFDSGDKFLPLIIAAKQIGITKFALRKILSFVKITLSEAYDKKNVDVGLSLINFARKMHIPYHFFYDNAARDWSISKEVVALVKEYVTRYPMLFQILDMADGDKDTKPIPANIIFPNEKNPDKATEDLFSWILSLPFSALPYVPMGTIFINQALRESLHNKLLTECDVQPCSITTIKEPLDLLVERSPWWIRASSSSSVKDFKPGDRVICIRTCGLNYVPFGCPGTLIGFSGRKALVDFDQQMVTGTGFGGQCAKSQGKVVDIYSLLNLFSERRRKDDHRKPDKNGKYHGKFYNAKKTEEKSQVVKEVPKDVLPPPPPVNPK